MSIFQFSFLIESGKTMRQWVKAFKVIAFLIILTLIVIFFSEELPKIIPDKYQYLLLFFAALTGVVGFYSDILQIIDNIKRPDSIEPSLYRIDQTIYQLSSGLEMLPPDYGHRIRDFLFEYLVLSHND